MVKTEKGLENELNYQPTKLAFKFLEKPRQARRNVFWKVVVLNGHV